jgi:hypothetical protein
LFRYEFVIRTNASVAESQALLEQYLCDQSRPRGFHVADTRFTGSVAGSTFSLRPWDAMLWGSVVPPIEGYFVPTPEGSDVMVAIGYDLPGWLPWLLATVVVTAAIWNIRNGVEGLLMTGFAALVGLALLVEPPLFHGRHTARIFARLYDASAAQGRSA